MRRLGIVLIACLALAACGGSDEPTPLASVPEGCAEVEIGEMEDRGHVAPGTPIEYDTDPPTSGPHYPAWSETGVWDTPLEDPTTVHNLEHGHVIVHHNGLDGAQLEAIEDLIDPKWVIVVPRPAMEAKLALTAWGVLQLCPSPPADVTTVVENFIDAYRGKAPETIAGEPR